MTLTSCRREPRLKMRFIWHGTMKVESCLTTDHCLYLNMVADLSLWQRLICSKRPITFQIKCRWCHSHSSAKCYWAFFQWGQKVRTKILLRKKPKRRWSTTVTSKGSDMHFSVTSMALTTNRNQTYSKWSGAKSSAGVKPAFAWKSTK
jgi:hypothetical protein